MGENREADERAQQVEDSQKKRRCGTARDLTC